MTTAELIRSLANRIHIEEDSANLTGSLRDEIDSYYAAEFKKIPLNDFVKKGLELSESERIYTFDGHLETQYSYLHDENGELLVDKVFKLEEFDECKLFLKSLTGIENFPHARPVATIQQTFSQASIDLIKDFYKKDFETFDYN